ncbi:MAG: Dyp-type peroxidase [Thermodesulfobacteriota bacterium]|jgi:putative iron-dependent peroxidase
MPTPQPAILNRNMGEHQWYVHLSRVDGADLEVIKSVIQHTRRACVERQINIVVGFGPTLLRDLTTDIPNDFQPFETIRSIDGSGREAKGTQEELLFWMNSPRKDQVWKTQWDARQALKGHMKVARETMTFIYGNSLDMTGFIDGTGNPPPEKDREVAIVPDGQPGAGGSFVLAQRWVHDLEAWEKLPVEEQERIFGRTKPDSTRLDKQAPYSHLSHVELRQGATADASKPKRDEITRRSTPYAFHDGTVGLYFMAFCKSQAPFRERLRAMYGLDGQVRDKLTDFSNPASGSFYFAPAVEALDAMLK